MKTNLDFLDSGSFLYIFIALAIVAIVAWSFLHEALKPLLAFFTKPKAAKPRAVSSTKKPAHAPNWKPDKPAQYNYADEHLNRELKTH